MDNFLIIDDVDTCYIEQNSWLILLQKQISRNYYLFKIYEKDKSGRKSKLNPKQLYLKMKCSINHRIKDKIKNRKNSQKTMCINDLSSASISLRRKTQEIHKKPLLKIQTKFEPSIQTAGRYFSSQKIQDSLDFGQSTKQSYRNCNFFLPSPGKSLAIDQSKTLVQKESAKFSQKRQNMTKFLSHSKPILSLHDLELNTRGIFPLQQSSQYKRLSHMQKLLIRSTMNSPKKEIQSKNTFTVKRTFELLPQIGRLNCKALAMSVYSNKNEKVLHIETQPVKYEKVYEQQKGTQETKQSESENMYGLESILQYYLKSGNKNKQEGFQDNHINKSMIKNYRISKVKNIRLPVH